MTPCLTKTKPNFKLHYFDENFHRQSGANPAMGGNYSDLYGDCTGLTGNCNHLYGNCSTLEGDATGVIGDCTGMHGNLNDAGLSAEDRKNGIRLNDLVKAVQ